MRSAQIRRGITLMEILICIGILSIGLLGVVSLIGVGSFAVVETAKVDHSTACAKSAKAQIRLRKMLDPNLWHDYNGAAAIGLVAGYPPAPAPQAIPSYTNGTLALDPLMMSRYPGVANLQKFPYYATMPATGNELDRITLTPADENCRITLISMTGTSNIPEYLAERIFQWEDDISITISDGDADLRPRQNFRCLDSSDQIQSAPLPYRPGEDDIDTSSYAPLIRESTGNYSWICTITPETPELELSPSQKTTFSVSVAVFYKRNTAFDANATIPQERMADVDASFSGVSGAGVSDVPLMLPPGVTADPMEYLKVESGQWVMLVGDVQDARFQDGWRHHVARWYRVQTVEDELSTIGSNTVRWITVSGPEWTLPAMQNTHVILVDDVIGVFTETMSIER